MRRILMTWIVLLIVPVSYGQQPTPEKILALGDSYTIGQSVDANQRWPVQLVLALEKQQISTTVDIIAATGWTTIELEQAIAASQLNTPYDVVTLLIGVNDQFRGASVANYKQNFKRLLKASIHYAGNDPKKVIVLSIPDYAATPFAQRFNPEAISRDLDAFNKVNKILSQKAGVTYVDVTPISRKAKNDNALIAFDGLHPSAIMYKQWVDKLLPVVKSVLDKKAKKTGDKN